ncbi:MULTISPECIES: restriction endonuclease subunit S [unclassified Flavobacterium]|jgi:type I restriction enzyme S subunit|uniref:restriction endonuclease subunit S n=1 Tax=unclassified Flavobacterium TaxID=196869 RepID=UPI0025BC888D|nr:MULTISPECIES: restriction endonuclease subunit S [unclassified Flavobacterium]
MPTANKNTPTLRFPEFKGEWELKKLGEITSWASGGTPPKDNPLYWDGDIPWISASSMRGIVYSDSELKITNAGLKKGSKLAKKGSLLILVRGSMLFNKIPIGIVSKDVAFNQDVKSIVVDNYSTSEFILNWFTAFEPMILNMVTGTGIGAGKLDLPDLKALEIQIPTLPEQQKIATFLTAVDKKLQALKQKKNLLEQYKKGVMQQIFSQELRFTDDKGNAFADWKKKKLGECLQSLPTKKHQIKTAEIKEFGKYKVIDQGQNLIAGYCDEIEFLFTNYPIIVFGDHTTALKYIDFEFVVGADGTKLLKCKNDNPKYVFYNLIFNNIQQQGYKRHFTMLSEIHLQIPSLKEQTKIANFLSAIDDKINQCQAQIANTEVWKKGLLQRMFV